MSEDTRAEDTNSKSIGEELDEEEVITVKDRRHWKQEDEEQGDEQEPPTVKTPSIIDEYRVRTEEAEKKLHEYIEAFKSHRAEQDEVRARLQRDVERRVHLQFGGLVRDLLGSIDNLDLALTHSGAVPEAQPLAQGVQMARDGFIETLLQAGVERIQPDGEEFDPNTAEAVRMDPVTDGAQDGRVTATLRPGYRLGDNIIRPAQVAVGRSS